MLSFLDQPEILAKMNEEGNYLHFAAGDVIVKNEKYIKVIPLVIKGTIKVSRIDKDGNELFLYYISAGQSCAVSLSTCLSYRRSNIYAVAEEDSELVAIPSAAAIKWFNENARWRSFVVRTMMFRFDELIKTIDHIAFSKMDDRLISFLSEKAKVLHTTVIHTTHEMIATELSTSREVVSRLLKQLEKEGRLKLSRNKIELKMPV